MKTRDKIILTIVIIIALASIALTDLATYKTELFGTKTGLILGIFVIIIGAWVWIMDPIITIFSKK